MMLRYGAAVCSVGLALLCIHYFAPRNEVVLSLLLVLAVATAAWFCGFGPALLSVAGGFLPAIWSIADSRHVNGTERPVWESLAYLVGALPILVFARSSQRAREEAAADRTALEREIAARLIAEDSLRNAQIALEERTRELNAALNAQQHQKERIETILDHLPVGVVLMNRSREVTFANRLFRERFGETAGRPCFHYIHHLNLPCESCRSLNGQENPDGASRLCTCDDGTVFEVSNFSFAGPDGTGGVLEVGLDITERLHAQARLSEQASLLQLAHDAIVVTDLSGVIRFWNHAAEQTYGWMEEEALGKKIEDLLHTTGSSSLHEIRAITRESGYWEGELSHLTRNGKPVIVESRWSLQRNPEGTPSAFLDINRDITKRRNAEEELRRNRESLSLAMEAGRCAAFEWDVRNGIWLWSPEMEELYGVPPGGFDGRRESWEALILQEDLPRVRESLDEPVGRPEYQSEWRIRRPKDGQIRWLATRAKWTFDGGGRPSRMHGINIDISDQKRAEETQRHSEERYRALVWATSQVVWTAGSDGFAGDSPSWRALTDQTAEQAVGFGWMDAIHPEDRDYALAMWRESVRNSSAFEFESRIRRHDGEYRDMAVRGVPLLDPDGGIREWVGTCSDITDKKRAKAELARKTEELARSNSELQHFAYVASHDLQEPLRLVANFTQLLAERYGPKLDENAREFIAFSVEGANRMRAMIQDLLAYSRVDTAAQTSQIVDCAESLGRAVWNLRSLIEEKCAVVTHDPLPTVVGHASQMVQLFQNLIGNAIKFNCAELPRVHVSAVRNETGWIFSVRDNGIGIEPQYHKRIFVIFQRIHRAEEYPGTGIGLALCKKIVERHGGEIWVESQPGAGSTFSFSWPESASFYQEQVSDE